VTLRLSGEQITAVQCASDRYHKLILALITHNIQQRYANGAYLDRAALQKLTRKSGLPEALGLPDGAGQMAAQIVWRMFIRYTCSAGKTEYNPALMDDPAKYNLYVRDIAAKQGRLRLPTIGWVSYLAPPAVTGLFESNGIHLKGAYLAHRNKLWRAEICFQRNNEKQIREDVGMAKALAQGYFTDDDEHDRDLCLLEVALDVVQERGLLFTQYLPTRLIIGKYEDMDIVKTDKMLAQSFARLGVCAPQRKIYRGLICRSDKLAECPASYSVEEIWRANARMNNSEMIDEGDSQ
jgi:hypothetical protein